jgi:hypothetical protein
LEMVNITLAAISATLPCIGHTAEFGHQAALTLSQLCHWATLLR